MEIFENDWDVSEDISVSSRFGVYTKYLHINEIGKLN